MNKKEIVKKPEKKDLLTRKLKDRKEIGFDFAAKVHRKFDTLIKASILFGSQAKNSSNSGSDIDIIFIIDDAAVNWDMELIAWYREELAKIIAENPYSKDLHINTVKLTSWWKDMLYGDPVVINILRYGEAIIDSGGFFNPLKALLLQGSLHTTPEAIYACLQRAPMHLTRSKIAELNAIEGIYWCMVDISQAALMAFGKLPPSPEHLPEMIKENIIDKNLAKSDYLVWLKQIISLHKSINHNEVNEIKGIDIDIWQSRAQSYMQDLTQIIDKIISKTISTNPN